MSLSLSASKHNHFDENEIRYIKNKNELDPKYQAVLRSSIVWKNFVDNYQSDEKELITSVYNGSCSSCYTNLPAQTLVDVNKGSSLIPCPSCSIFLYSDE